MEGLLCAGSILGTLYVTLLMPFHSRLIHINSTPVTFRTWTSGTLFLTTPTSIGYNTLTLSVSLPATEQGVSPQVLTAAASLTLQGEDRSVDDCFYSIPESTAKRQNI